MKIAFFVGGFPRLSETFVINQAAALIEAGFDLDILALDREESGLVHPLVGDADLMARASFLSDKLAWQAARYLRRPYRLRLALERWGLRQTTQFNGGAYDVILCHFGPQGLRACELRASGLLTGEVWTVFHGYDVSTVLREDPHAYDRLFVEGDYFLPVSAYWRTRLEGLGCPKDRLSVHHMGVDTALFPYRAPPAIQARPAEILSVCRLVEKKGLSFALQALALVAQRAPALQWRHTIVGEGPLAEALKAQAAELGLAERVSFVGSTSTNAVRAQLRLADLFLLPSVKAADGDMEGIPVSLMEAMATGTPVLSTTHSGIPELITHDESGLLAPERDVEALAQNLLRALTEPALRERLAANARRSVQEGFDNQRLNQRLAGLIRDRVALEGAPPAAVSRAFA